MGKAKECDLSGCDQCFMLQAFLAVVRLLHAQMNSSAWKKGTP